MARKRKKNSDTPSFLETTSRETRNAILGVISIVVAATLLLASWGIGGRVGNLIYSSFSYLFGMGYFLISAVFILLAVSLFRSEERDFAKRQIAGSVLLFISALGLVDLFLGSRGGIVGHFISSPLVSLFEVIVSGIILVALIVISVLVIFDTSIKLDIFELFNKVFRRQESDEEYLESEAYVVEENGKTLPEEEPEPTYKPSTKKAQESDEESFTPIPIRTSGKKWAPPPLSLLGRDKGKPGVGDIKANANLIKRTLQNFGILVEMDEISIGPTVTRYALKPAEGVKLSKILGLQNNLELALAAHPVRIEAPIPGKSLVGIEVPNTMKSTIGLGSLIDEVGFSGNPNPLLIALGRDISGHSHFANVSKMPHLLIAGATGSGKSVSIHAIVTSLIFRNPPENLKFIMIDPKRVELTLYNGIPHLLTPVITDPKKSILALKWVAKEMDRRYDLFEEHRVRDIHSYHKNILLPALEKNKKGEEEVDPMPYIVVVIDELADLMQTYPRELEAGIVRLAQMSRAVGIHLIISTQRPSVNVITGLIKANIPTRIALQVASQIDSRTILDASGAEKLLGAGDMLYQSGDMGKPIRIQSAYISESEVKEVVKYLKEEYAETLETQISLSQESSENSIFSATLNEEDPSDEDDLYDEAKDTVIGAGKASASFLQRKLRIGYARAARLIDMLEENGVVGPGEGAKPREILTNEGADDYQDDLETERD